MSLYPYLISLKIAFTGISYARYYGDSYLEFQGLHLNIQNVIRLEFKTYKPHGLLLYIEQSPETVGRFLIQLFIKSGTLQYRFLCDEAAKLRNINTTARVDDGRWYKVQIWQGMAPCEAEISVAGISTKTSMPSNFWSNSYRLETGSIFVGGLPHPYAIKQMPGPVYNFTGCIGVIEINNVGPFNFSNAMGINNIDNCRIPAPTHLSTTFPMAAAAMSELPEPVVPSLISPELPSVCQKGLCRNGGTCSPTYLPTGATSFQCDCPLHFTGRFCEKEEIPFALLKLADILDDEI
nr:PREDICTED: protein eyes shut homolog [Struthio camelus australis]